MDATPPKSRRKQWRRKALAGMVIFICAGAVAYSFPKATNCGGNSAARSVCSNYLWLAAEWELAHPGEDIRSAPSKSELRQEMANLAGLNWVDAQFFAKPREVRIDRDAPRQIVIVCNHANDNFPSRIPFWTPKTHAVGYSTGEVGLIRQSEFAQLDLSDFFDLSAAFPRDVVPD
jgi:hypothetical protein